MIVHRSNSFVHDSFVPQFVHYSSQSHVCFHLVSCTPSTGFLLVISQHLLIPSRSHRRRAMSDPRFARLKSDPRFRRPKKQRSKVVVDDRFKGIFDQDRTGKTESKQKGKRQERLGAHSKLHRCIFCTLILAMRLQQAGWINSVVKFLIPMRRTTSGGFIG